MIKNFKKTIGYVCPECSAMGMTEVTPFSFSGTDTIRFYCKKHNCRELCFSVTPGRDKYSITVECPVCGDTHHFSFHKDAFWERDYIQFNCSDLGLEMMFIGSPERVKVELNNQKEMLREFEDEFSINDELSSIFDAVEHINELTKTNSVFCSCGSEKITIEIDVEGIVLTCRECGKIMTIPTTPESLEKLIKSDSIVLE